MNWKVGGKYGWPYGPNINKESQERLLAWCEEERMVWAEKWNCFHYLKNTSHNRDGVYREDMRWNGFRWMDHVTCWNQYGERYLVTQPYIDPEKYRAEIEAIATFNGWKATILPSGWYGHNACFIAFGSRELSTGG